MKTNRLLRVLSLLAFLLLMAPFYDSCNGHRMKEAEAVDAVVADTTAVEVDNTKIDSTKIDSTEIDTINNSVENYELSFVDKAYESIDDDDSENAFEFAKLSIDSILEFNFKDFKKGVKDEGYGVVFFELKNFCFILIVVITLLIAVFSFKNSQRVYKLSKYNLVLLLITIICLFLEGLFETISQIKWGYYAFIITNLIIFYYSKPNKIQT